MQPDPLEIAVEMASKPPLAVQVRACREEASMKRHVGIVGCLFALLVGCVGQQSAVTPQRLPDDAVGTLTTKEAIGKLGAPTYERLCEDGSTTLGWKQAAPPPAALPEPGRLLVIRSRGEESKETLVCKFDKSGRLLWWREVR